MKSGRQLLQKYSCERAMAAKDGYAVAVNRMHRYRWNGHCMDTVIRTEEGTTVLFSFAYFFIRLP